MNLLKNYVTTLRSKKPERLPPTELYFTVLEPTYKCRNGVTLSSLGPEDWGWKKVENEVVPITTDLPAAPKDILQIIRCSCKTGCSSYQCSCRKNEMLCSDCCNT